MENEVEVNAIKLEVERIGSEECRCNLHIGQVDQGVVEKITRIGSHKAFHNDMLKELWKIVEDSEDSDGYNEC